jgi:carboxyl-terminal processing protease
MNNQPAQNKRSQLFLPLIFAVILIIGIVIGLMLNRSSSQKESLFTKSHYDKMDEVLGYINRLYVDSVDKDELFRVAVDEVFDQLDPHSMYISAEEIMRIREPLIGHFEGIGVEFYVLNDTVQVVNVLSGGPSELLGIKAGDKIVKIEDTVVAGIGIDNRDVVAKLKGPKGSAVRVSIMRADVDTLIPFTIQRGPVKINSVDAGYMLDDKTGYIRITRFAANTHEDFVERLEKLKENGMKTLILDLRDNSGGYLDQAKRIADEFLDDHKLIVYTEGRNFKKDELFAENPGEFEKGKLIVLINENSASASEILAGALQDWGRATIMGRRSYGKALVQQEYKLQDGAAMRLTIARYYTPKGRSIQRSYSDGVKAYREEHYTRMMSEYEHSDSFANNDTAHYGIMPDVYIPFDTSKEYRSITSLVSKGYVPEYAYHYFSSHANSFFDYKSLPDFLKQYHVSDKMLNDFVEYNNLKDSVRISGNYITYRNSKLSKQDLKTLLKAFLGKQLFYYDAYVPLLKELDKELKTALEFSREKE